MKKISLIFILMMSMILGSMTSYANDVPTWEKVFEDDFENYQVGKVETQNTFTSRWTNDGWNGTNNNPVDINDVATIRSEDGNKFLNINYNSSFFYMSPHTLRAKNFEVEFDTRSHDLTDAWVGINMRKEYRDIRYNGGTGLMFYFRTKYITDSEDNIIGESLVIHALRGGSLSTTDLDSLLVGNRVIEYVYPEDDPIDPTQQIKSKWFNIRIKVSETTNNNEALYEVFIDDVAMATLTYARASLNLHGFIGLHGCTGDIDVDNFRISSNDEVAPPPMIRVNRLVEPLGKVGELFTFPGEGEHDIELIDDEDGIAKIVILQPDSTELEIDENIFSFTPTMSGIHTLKYIAESAYGVEGTIEFLINVQPADEEPIDDPDDNEEPIDDPDDNEEPIDDPDDEEPSSSNTAIIVVSVIGGLALTGLGGYLFVFKRK